MNQRRSEIIGRYLEGIKNINKIEPLLPFEPDKYVYQMFGIRCDNRDDLISFLKSKDIATGCHYTPLHTQPLFKQFRGICPVADAEYPRMVTLPLHTDLKDEEKVASP